RQKQASAAAPARLPKIAAAAKPVPWPSATKRITGPEVNGKPTNQPPTVSPQRRPARLAPRISSGVAHSLKANREPAMSGASRANRGRAPYKTRQTVAGKFAVTVAAAQGRG